MRLFSVLFLLLLCTCVQPWTSWFIDALKSVNDGIDTVKNKTLETLNSVSVLYSNVSAQMAEFGGDVKDKFNNLSDDSKKLFNENEVLVKFANIPEVFDNAVSFVKHGVVDKIPALVNNMDVLKQIEAFFENQDLLKKIDTFLQNPPLVNHIKEFAENTNLLREIETFVANPPLVSHIQDFATNSQLLEKIKTFVTNPPLVEHIQEFATNSKLLEHIETFVSNPPLVKDIKEFATNGELLKNIESFVKNPPLVSHIEQFAMNSKLLEKVKTFVQNPPLVHHIKDFATDSKLLEKIELFVSYPPLVVHIKEFASNSDLLENIDKFVGKDAIMKYFDTVKTVVTNPTIFERVKILFDTTILDNVKLLFDKVNVIGRVKKFVNEDMRVVVTFFDDNVVSSIVDFYNNELVANIMKVVNGVESEFNELKTDLNFIPKVRQFFKNDLIPVYGKVESKWTEFNYKAVVDKLTSLRLPDEVYAFFEDPTHKEKAAKFFTTFIYNSSEHVKPLDLAKRFEELKTHEEMHYQMNYFFSDRNEIMQTVKYMMDTAFIVVDSIKKITTDFNGFIEKRNPIDQVITLFQNKPLIDRIVKKWNENKPVKKLIDFFQNKNMVKVIQKVTSIVNERVTSSIVKIFQNQKIQEFVHELFTNATLINRVTGLIENVVSNKTVCEEIEEMFASNGSLDRVFHIIDARMSRQMWTGPVGHTGVGNGRVVNAMRSYVAPNASIEQKQYDDYDYSTTELYDNAKYVNKNAEFVRNTLKVLKSGDNLFLHVLNHRHTLYDIGHLINNKKFSKFMWKAMKYIEILNIAVEAVHDSVIKKKVIDVLANVEAAKELIGFARDPDMLYMHLEIAENLKQVVDQWDAVNDLMNSVEDSNAIDSFNQFITNINITESLKRFAADMNIEQNLKDFAGDSDLIKAIKKLSENPPSTIHVFLDAIRELDDIPALLKSFDVITPIVNFVSDTDMLANVIHMIRNLDVGEGFATLAKSGGDKVTNFGKAFTDTRGMRKMIKYIRNPKLLTSMIATAIDPELINIAFKILNNPEITQTAIVMTVQPLMVADILRFVCSENIVNNTIDLVEGVMVNSTFEFIRNLPGLGKFLDRMTNPLLIQQLERMTNSTTMSDFDMIVNDPMTIKKLFGFIMSAPSLSNIPQFVKNLTAAYADEPVHDDGYYNGDYDNAPYYGEQSPEYEGGSGQQYSDFSNVSGESYDEKENSGEYDDAAHEDESGQHYEDYEDGSEADDYVQFSGEYDEPFEGSGEGQRDDNDDGSGETVEHLNEDIEGSGQYDDYDDGSGQDDTDEEVFGKSSEEDFSGEIDSSGELNTKEGYDSDYEYDNDMDTTSH